MIKGATLQNAAEELTKNITDLFERIKAINRIREDWDNRKRWIDSIIRLNENTFVSEIAASIQEASRYSWLEYSKGKTSTARIVALRTIMMGKYRLGILLMRAGIVEEVTQHFESTMTIAGTVFDLDPDLKKTLLTINPPWAVNPGPDVKVTHGQAVWYLNPAYPNYIQIDEETSILIDATTGYEGYLYVQTTISSPTYRESNYRVYEKIMWDNNYIEIMDVERASADYSSGSLVFSANGIFTGQGIIDGQKVQVTGVREATLQLPNPAILDCTGTIRFLGTTP